MKNYAPADIRNFAVVGHASSGKTMLCEAMLACGGVINRMGRIADGSTVSDYHVSEKTNARRSLKKEDRMTDSRGISNVTSNE